MRFFFFGLLRDTDMLELVIGRSPAQPFPRARLGGARLVRLRNETFPMLVPAPGAWVPGVIVEGLTDADLERIAFFESVEYQPSPIEVEPREGGRIEALVFATTARAVHDNETWRFEDWVARHKAKALHEARHWMAFCGRVTVEEADRLWDEALAAARPIEDLVCEVCGARVRAGPSSGHLPRPDPTTPRHDPTIKKP